jgi:perosamine synthetase
MTYQREVFNNAERSAFLKALAAEGIQLDGYIRQGLHREPWVDHILNSKVYQKMFSRDRLKKYREERECPNCDGVCGEVVVLWASGPLLGSAGDMDDIADSILKVYENRDQLSTI